MPQSHPQRSQRWQYLDDLSLPFDRPLPSAIVLPKTRPMPTWKTAPELPPFPQRRSPDEFLESAPDFTPDELPSHRPTLPPLPAAPVPEGESFDLSPFLAPEPPEERSDVSP